jgi:hypothetical protein
MRQRLIGIFITLAIIVVPSSLAQGGKKSAPKQQQKSETTLTGCVDQQEGRYVLVDDRGLKKISELEADGFPVEGFAKHLGHKVVVRGTSITGDKALFKVRAVETVSETCAPGNNQQGRQ